MTVSAAPIAILRRRASRVAALAQTPQGWRLVVVDRGTPPRLVESRPLADADFPNLSATLRSLKVGVLARVAPAGECIAKLSPAPQCAAAELPAALDVIASVDIPDDVPEHRRGAGILPLASGKFALAAGWRGQPAAIKTDADQIFITEPAAALAFAGPAPLAFSADARTGSAFIYASGPEGTHLRCTKLDARDNRFADGLRKAVHAVAASAGVDPPSDDPVPAASIGLEADLPHSLAEHASRLCSNLRTDDHWLRQHAVAIGAALLALNHDPAVEGLASLRAAAGDGPRSPIARTALWLSVPRHAAAVLAIGAAAALLLPIATAYARLKIVESKSLAMGDAEKRRKDLSRDAALYRQLSAKRWPMTKLLADLSRAAPVGITIDQLNIEQEGSGGIRISGKADNADALTKFQTNLDNTGVLGSVALSDVKNTQSGVEFSVIAKVRDALVASSVKEDFVAKTLQARMYPNGGGTRVVEEGSEDKPEKSDDLAADTKGDSNKDDPATPTRGGNGRGFRAENAKPTDSKASKDEIPPPLSDADIAALDKSKLTLEWAKRKAASQKSGLDPSIKARLDEEVKKLDARRQEAK